jgi:hypothetical protein
MKIALGLSITCSVVAMIVAAFLSLQYVRLQEETLSLKMNWTRVAAREPGPAPRAERPAPRTMAAAPAEATLELADVMGKLQLHANKLFFAGTKQNWKLAAFYVEELEETVADIKRRENVMHGQINVSGLMPALLMPEIETLERITNNKEAEEFPKSYTRLVNGCNTCHQAAQLPFIVISEPKTPALDNQRYEPIEPVAK